MKRPRPVVLLPVKAPSRGKSRLAVPAHLRPGLATAFALDALDAALATPGVAEVVVVTDDDEFARHCRDRGVATVPDGDGLNASLVRATSAVRSRHPDGLPVAVCADLPCLLPADLGSALEQVLGGGAWFTADAEGTGTTMYAAPYDAFDPQFGAGSRAAHLAAGTREVVGTLSTLRRDVDDEQTLASALALGPGTHTRDAVALLPGRS